MVLLLQLPKLLEQFGRAAQWFSSAEPIAAMSQEIDAAQHQVHRGLIKSPQPGPELLESVLQLVCQDGDAVEAHHARGALDRMDQAKGLVQLIHAVRITLQDQQRFDQIIKLFLGFIQEDLEILRGVIGRRIARVIKAVRHDGAPRGECEWLVASCHSHLPPATRHSHTF